MKTKGPVSLVFLLLVLTGSAQIQLKIKGCIKGLPYSKAYLAEIVGGRINYLDSSLVYNNCFDFYVSDSVQPGMYSIVFSKERNSFVRIIVNAKEDIVFNSVYNRLLDSMTFQKSRENAVYYSYLKHVAISNEKRNLLTRMIAIGDNPILAKNLRSELSSFASNDSRFTLDLI